MKWSIATMVILMAVLLTAPVQASLRLEPSNNPPDPVATFGFQNITNNIPVNVDVASQFFVDVYDGAVVGLYNGAVVNSETLDSNYVLFVIHNEGPIASNIAEVYFDDGALLGPVKLYDDDDPNYSRPTLFSIVADATAVDFDLGAIEPGELPGANNANPDFETSKYVTTPFGADSASGNSKGINPGENLGIAFELLPDKTVQDVLDAFAFKNGLELRVGLHVRSIGTTDKSDSFVNSVPTTPGGGGGSQIPEPATLVVWSALAVLGAIPAFKRRRVA